MTSIGTSSSGCCITRGGSARFKTGPSSCVVIPVHYSPVPPLTLEMPCRSRKPWKKSWNRVCVLLDSSRSRDVPADRPRHTQDEDLAAMYLSDKKANKSRSLNDHEDLEVLLESFSKQVEEIVNEAETISVSILILLPRFDSLLRRKATASNTLIFLIFLRVTCNRHKRSSSLYWTRTGINCWRLI